MTTERDLIQRLADALHDAAEDVEGWGNYASIYFQEKHDLSGNVAKIHALAKEARAFLDQSEPEEPTDEELLAIAAASIDGYQGCGIAIGEYEPENECAVEAYGSDLIAFARAVRARWPLAAIKPIPVSERLPGPEDCMDEGWAWFYASRGDWIKAVLPVSPAYTHWLPHYALPFPSLHRRHHA